MTRALLLVAAAALLAVVGCSAPEAPQATATSAPAAPAANPQPVVVHILVPEEPALEVQAWAQALAAAIEAGHGALTLAATPEEAVAVVRIDSVQTGVEWVPEPPGEGEISVMHFALMLGESSREFDIAYRGDATPQAEALARNLRGVAANAAAAAAEGAEDTEPPAADETDAGDEG
jgi:hypothetical protein